ncbi:MAG: Na(+)/H(+) antiporter subunit B [Candidatus Hadarchaeales archaeon]
MEVFIHNFLMIAMFLFYLLAVEMKDLLHSVILLAGGSIALAVIFYMLQAPDIAITQATVGAGISTILFVIAISRTRRSE